jgi:uncharacterized repeat protein (TIGR01451 family)
MRRIAITLTVLALVAGTFACSSDAPTPPKAGGPGGGGQNPDGSSALQIRLFTSDPNPLAGTCTLIQAIVTLNGNPVPNGTGVSFSTDFGVFAQNGLPLISVVTQNGAALTALCSEFPGTAIVRATASSGGQSGSATISIAFQPASAGAGPFVSFCDPSFGPSTGGTLLTLRGGRFCPNSGCTGNEAATTRVSFIVNGVAREATVTSVTASTISLLTPGFPEVTSPTTPVEIRVTLNNNTATPTVLTLPNCFAFGTTLSTTPTITAVLPASGTNEGETRVTIIGSGFRAPVQVFFGDVEATIVSVSFNQIVVLTPPAFGAGRDNLNETVDVRVRDVTSGLEATLADGYRYVQPLQLIAIAPNEQRLDQPFILVTIFGHGFQAPVAVTLAGRPATVVSVSESELVVLPSRPLTPGCANLSGIVTVTNINTGDTESGLSFTYLAGAGTPVILLIAPTQGAVGTVVTVTGSNLPLTIADADVRFGTRQATVTAASATGLTVVAPDNGAAAPVCPTGTAVGTVLPVGAPVGIVVANRLTGCAVTSPPFQYQAACVPPTPTPTGTLTSTPTATVTSTPTPTATVTPVPADLALTKVDSPDPVATTGVLTYTITVTNSGPGTATDVTMTDSIPVGTTILSCSSSQGPCSHTAVGTNGPVIASIGTMGPAGSVTVTINVTVTAAAATVLSNTATVSSPTSDPNGANNLDTETTTVGP